MTPNDLNLMSDCNQAVREKALRSLVNRLTNNVDHDFAEQFFMTLLFHCLNVVAKAGTSKGSKKVSKREIQLALKVIAFVAINLVHADYSHQVYKESVSILSRALVQFESDPDTMVMALETFAVVGFFGCTHYEETQSIMLKIWDYVLNHNMNNLVKSRAISTWLLLLSGMEECHVSYKYWKHVVSDLFDVLNNVDHDDDDHALVIMVVVEAVALIFNGGLLNKFAGEEEGEEAMIMERIVDKLWEVTIHKETKEQHWEALEVFDKDEDGNYSKIEDIAEIVQGNFFKDLLGAKAFEKHVTKNSNLLWLKPCYIESNDKLHDKDSFVAERVEVTVNFYRRGAERHQFKKVQKRMVKSPCSSLNKARSLLLKKQREVRTSYVFGNELDY